MIYVHQLVAEAWVHNPCPGVFKHVDHIDRDSQNNSAENLRWVTHQLNCLNRTVKGWEKMVKPTGAVFYRSVVRCSEERKVTYCRNKEEAIEATRRIQQLFFDQIYQRHVDDFESSNLDAERLAYHVLWTDRVLDTPEGFTPDGPGVCRFDEGRSPQFTI